MFENLTDRLNRAFKKLAGSGHLKEEHIKDTLKEVREALLEADVALSVVKEFVHTVQEKAIGQSVAAHLSPQQAFLKIVNDELVQLMGEANVGLNLKTLPPVIILVAGLQGSGKTTTVAKMARWLHEHEHKSIAVVSADIYRPAAIEQLKALSFEAKANFIENVPGNTPLQIVEKAILQARKQQQDVLIIDTAGRLHVNQMMMDEIKAIYRVAAPVEVLFVVDSMTGQDAANTARAFNDVLPLTGIVLTKTDGDSRGGAALSIRRITGKPIKFVGVGEKIEALEPFHPERLASRILGMGDILSLIEEVERKVDKEKAQALSKKLQKGQGFNLQDLRDQMKQMLNLGGMKNLLDKLPGMGALPTGMKAKINDKELIRSIAILDSMTLWERYYPHVIANSGARKRRIALGSGTHIQEVNRVLKQHTEMQKMMKKMNGKGGVARLMRTLQDRLPPGAFSK